MIQTMRAASSDAEQLEAAVGAVPPGGWAVGVSGGADSVALLMLLRRRPDLSLHVVHLNHEARGAASDADERFVHDLACDMGLPFALGRWHSLSPSLGDLPQNRSARFRAGRFELFNRVVKDHSLEGIILGHHADDVAETVFLRLLRGGRPTGLAAMGERSVVGGLVVLRPLLRVRRAILRQHLSALGQVWREDESNASPRYLRNRIRAMLAARPELTEPLLALANECGNLKEWINREAPPATDGQLPASLLNDLPPPLAEEAARRWLIARGVPPGDLAASVLRRLIAMAADAASPSRRHFPGKILVRRRRGLLFVERSQNG